MLSTVIRNAQNLAAQVASWPPSSGPVNDTRAHAQAFNTSVVPQISGTQTAVQQFATTAQATVDTLLAQVNQSSAPLGSNLGQALSALAAQATTLQNQLNALSAQTNAARSQFASDNGALMNAQAQARAQLAGSAAERDHWQSVADELRTRSTWTNIFGSIFPLVKIGDEIASLIQYQKTTEAALADANAKYAQAAQVSAQLDVQANQFGAMASLVGQLADGVQSLSNAMNFVAADLNNQASFANLTTQQNAVLFLTALKTSLANLVVEAS
jgi:Bacillus haemolytic enterotoxin (HBL)